MIYEFTNNAQTTLANAITATTINIVVATGTGALFPTPTTGYGFKVTILDAATQLVNEIVLCTARAGDVLTVQRAQEGTTARAWGSADIVSLLVTAGELASFVQVDQLQSSTYFSAAGSGTGDNIIATLASNLVGIPDGFNFVVEAPAANTGATTLTLTLGTTVQQAHPIVKFGNAALNAGDIPAQYYPINLTYSSAWSAFVMNNPATSVAGSIAGGGAKQLLVQASAGNTSFVPAPTLANTFLGYNGATIGWSAPSLNTAINLSGGATYQIAYQSAASTTTFAPAPTTAGTYLSFTGTGFAWGSAPPSGVATSLQTANYTVSEIGGNLVISYQGTPIVSFNSTGQMRALGSVISATTP